MIIIVENVYRGSAPAAYLGGLAPYIFVPMCEKQASGLINYHLSK